MTLPVTLPVTTAAPILDLIEAFRRSKTMFTAVTLGIFDSLATGVMSSAALCAQLRLSELACTRLLDGCVSLGLLEKQGGSYRNAPVSQKYLVSSSPDTLSNYIRYSNQSLYPLWGKLDDAIREGSNRWTQVFGSRHALFDHYFRDDAAAGAFLGGMHGFGQLTSPLLVKAFDLSRFRALVDLGGATGHLAIAACLEYPELHATVVDLPRVEPFARRTIEASPVHARIQVLAADFFSHDLPAGDLYCLGRILHDWSDDKTIPLLARIREKLPQQGALLIGEILVDDDRSGPVRALMQDLNMLVCTDGRERTRAEYRELLQHTGFSAVEFRHTGSLIDAILAHK